MACVPDLPERLKGRVFLCTASSILLSFLGKGCSRVCSRSGGAPAHLDSLGSKFSEEPQVCREGLVGESEDSKWASRYVSGLLRTSPTKFHLLVTHALLSVGVEKQDGGRA